VTPLQLTRAVAAVANGGRLWRPYVVAAVANGDAGGRRAFEPELQGRPVAPEVASELARLMAGVVEEGTGRRARVEGFAVAGKTGTAQKVVAGRYSQSRFIASFVGFAPVETPRLVALVALDEPRPAYHGGQVAAPVFGALARQILLYWGVPPSTVVPPQEPRPPP
jgi:stage V sporulation protein D (sporulation-specific penicillin-binding protein)